MLALQVVTLSLYICCISCLSLHRISRGNQQVFDSSEDGSPGEFVTISSPKQSSIWNNVILVGKTGSDASNDESEPNSGQFSGGLGSSNHKGLSDVIADLANRTEMSLNSISYIPLSPPNSNDFDRKEKQDSYLEDFEKIEMHKNNHQSKGSSSGYSATHLPRGHHHSNPYQLSSSSLAHYSKILPHYSGANILSQNSYNLNYIHSLLTKPASLGSNSISSPLSSSQSSLNSNPTTYSYSLASSLPVSNQMSHLVSNSAQTGQAFHVDRNHRHQYHTDSVVSSLADSTSSLTSNSDSSCGRQQVIVREPRIVGGNNTYEGEFPWAVSIQRHGNHHCGGVIVGRRWVLTAAHCVRSQLVGNLVVRTGGHTLSRSINNINSHLERDYLVEQIVMHDDFSRYDNLTASQMKSSANTNNADIALLKLKSDIQWNELAWPVCFPDRESGNFSGHDAIVIGWGKLSEKSEDFSNELQKVKLNIIDNKVCQNWFRQAGREMPIDDRIICAGFKNGGKDACHGDSGGPLLSKINGHYVVVGVVSTGIGCARPLLPGLYSRVSSYISWIERHIS